MEISTKFFSTVIHNKNFPVPTEAALLSYLPGGPGGPIRWSSVHPLYSIAVDARRQRSDTVTCPALGCTSTTHGLQLQLDKRPSPGVISLDGCPQLEHFVVVMPCIMSLLML